MKKFFDRYFVLSLGMIFCLIVIETTLFIAGSLENAKNESVRLSDSSSFRILCIGNSYTQGAGAPAGENYPAILERILNQRNGKKYQVFNKGKGNINSSFIAQHLPKWLEETKPHMVFAMVGEPNSWNKYGYWDYLRKNRVKVIDPASHLEFFRRFRVFRLFELFKNRTESWNVTKDTDFSVGFPGMRMVTPQEKYFLGYVWLGTLEDGGNYKIEEMDAEQVEEVISTLKTVYDKDHNPIAARLLANVYLKKNALDQSIFYLEQEARINKYFSYPSWKLVNLLLSFPQNQTNEKLIQIKSLLLKKTNWKMIEDAEVYFSSKSMAHEKSLSSDYHYQMFQIHPTHSTNLLAMAYKTVPTNPRRAVEIAKEAIKLNPLAPNAHYLQIITHYVFMINKELKSQFDEELKKISIKLGVTELKSLNKVNIENWIVADIEDIIAMTNAFGARAVIQTYPPYRNDLTRYADKVLRKWSRDNNTRRDFIFQDIGLKFTDQFQKPSVSKESFYSSEYGPADNHLNGFGYGEIARHMGELIP